MQELRLPPSTTWQSSTHSQVGSAMHAVNARQHDCCAHCRHASSGTAPHTPLPVSGSPLEESAAGIVVVPEPAVASVVLVTVVADPALVSVAAADIDDAVVAESDIMLGVPPPVVGLVTAPVEGPLPPPSPSPPSSPPHATNRPSARPTKVDSTARMGPRYHQRRGRFGCDAGDGIVEGDELCDDGNEVAGDGCSATCEPSGEVLSFSLWPPRSRVSARGSEIRRLPEGGFVVLGNRLAVAGERQTHVLGFDDALAPTWQAHLFGRLSADGDVLWETTHHVYDTPTHDVTTDLVLDGDDYVVTGCATGEIEGPRLWLARVRG